MKSIQRSSRFRTRRRGQTLVETALVMVFILLPITVGILQFGIVLNATNSLTQIAREGGRYAAVHGTENLSDAAIKAYVRQCAVGTSVPSTDLTDARIVISMVNGLPRNSGNAINVAVTYPMANKVFISSFFPGVASLKKNYTAESTFVLE